MSIIRIYSPLPDSEKMYAFQSSICAPLQYRKRFIGTSIMTLGVSIENDAAYFLQEDCWLVNEDDEPYIIVNRKEQRDRVDIVAYSPHYGLTRRITIPDEGDYAIASSGSADKVVKDFITAVQDYSAEKDLGIICAAAGAGTTIYDQTRLKNLGDEVVRVLTGANRGERFEWTDEGIEFDTYAGTDRSADCVFRGTLRNLADYSYQLDRTIEQTTVYVAGQGQGDEREIVVIGDTAEGWRRSEVMIDARDVETGDTDKLTERGQQAIVSEGVQISGTVEDGVNLTYGVDYGLGDIVTVQMPKKTYEKTEAGFYRPVDEWRTAQLPIAEAWITFDGENKTIDLIYGEVRPSETATLRRDVQQLKSTEEGGGIAGGDVVGAGESGNENIVLFDGLTGKIIKDSGKKITDISMIASLGNQSAETGRNVLSSGVYSYNVANASLGDSTPVAYWSVLGFGRGTSGMAELAMSWTSNGVELWYRSLRDVTDNWWAWKKIWHESSDGASSGLDADKLDGQEGAYYAKASDVPSTTYNAKSHSLAADTDYTVALAEGESAFFAIVGEWTSGDVKMYVESDTTVGNYRSVYWRSDDSDYTGANIISYGNDASFKYSAQGTITVLNGQIIITGSGIRGSSGTAYTGEFNLIYTAAALTKIRFNDAVELTFIKKN